MNTNRIIARASVSALALAAVAPALAQSTGSQAFDAPQIVVTGAKGPKAVAGISIPDTPKTRQVLTQAFITHQTPGQAISDIINQMPGVSFQNNDGYGSGGGFLTIRGFDQSRISKTFDGIPLNDTGNYALYSNQDLDPELIDQVNVSLGSTDIDSPTPAATGSTVNYVTAQPTEDFHVRMQASVGEYSEFRLFGKLDTGTFTPFGTRAWIAASKQTYNAPFDNYGKVDKQQFNAKIYQPIGTNGDFVSVGGHFNKNHNNFYGSAPLRNDSTIRQGSDGNAVVPAGVIVTTPSGATIIGTGASVFLPGGSIIGTRVSGPDSSVNRFAQDGDERNYNNQLYYKIGGCNRITPTPGVADVETTTLSSLSTNQNANACGSVFDYRFNPSKTGNIRINSRFTLAQGLILTVDPFYEYTDANGGGTMKALEGTFASKNPTTGVISQLTGAIGGSFYAGKDLNGDGDTKDTVLLLAPSNTVTNRYGVITNLLWNFTPTQTVRLNYTLDYGHHRQTGEASFLDAHGNPVNLFPHDNEGIADANGNELQKRDRTSLAILNQVAGQYRGKFFDNKLTVEAGARAAFFQRKLHNYCFATSGGGFVDCLESDAEAAIYAANNPYSYNATTNKVTGYSLPQKRNYHFNKVLPAAGLTYQLMPSVSVYASYSKGLQVPGTDQLYNAFYYPQSADAASPKPETSDNFDAGVRMRSGKVQAQFAGWYTIFKNRIEQNYDPILQLSTYTNLGTVHKYGFDGSVSYQVDTHLSVYAFGSYLHSKIQDDVQLGSCASTGATAGQQNLVGPNAACAPGAAIFANTAGKRESGAPVYTLGGRIEGNVGPLQIGVQYKRTGPRYINDQNTPVYQSYSNTVAGKTSYTFYQVYGRKTPAFNIVDLDARLSMKQFGFNDRTYLQFNVTNLFDKFYVGASSTGNATASNTTVNFWQIGAPRTISGTLSVGF
jgi:iron complex outermembrane receptor protein